MKGNSQVIDGLNKLLAYELLAMDQYFCHAEMYADQGLWKLYERVDHEFYDERDHAKKLIARILFLEGRPDMVTREAIRIGKDVPDMLDADLQVEYAVANALKDVIAVCETVKDYQTREILEELLDDTEVDHAWWLEKQLGLIQKVGLENYQQAMMGEEPSPGS